MDVKFAPNNEVNYIINCIIFTRVAGKGAYFMNKWWVWSRWCTYSCWKKGFHGIVKLTPFMLLTSFYHRSWAKFLRSENTNEMKNVLDSQNEVHFKRLNSHFIDFFLFTVTAWIRVGLVKTMVHSKVSEWKKVITLLRLESRRWFMVKNARKSHDNPWALYVWTVRNCRFFSWVNCVLSSPNGKASVFPSSLMQIKYHEKFIQIFIVVRTINFYSWAFGSNPFVSERWNIEILMLGNHFHSSMLSLIYSYNLMPHLSNSYFIAWPKIINSLPLKMSIFLAMAKSENRIRFDRQRRSERMKCKFIQ